MRIAIVSDIHANIHALEKVVQSAESRSPETWYCLGDIVGYGAFPQECCDIVREKCSKTVFGNHEYGLLYPFHTDSFNLHAKKAIDYARKILNEETVEWLRMMEPHLILDNITIAHGSIRDFDEYVSDATIARLSLEIMLTDVLFVGHTHYPEGYVFDRGNRAARAMDLYGEGTAILEKGFKYLINCGSVGQPRDGDPRASYGIFDTETQEIEIIRVEYDIKKAADAIKEAGLPEFLSQRLFAGR